jgi:hypothetical protein
LEKKENSLLLKDQVLTDILSIDDNSVRVFASKQDKEKNIPEFVLYKEEVDIFLKMLQVFSEQELEELYESKGMVKFSPKVLKSFQSKKLPEKYVYYPKSKQPLKGLRVALDPGHIGGDMETAIKEHRYMWMKLMSGEEIQFNEGEIALVTAKVLRAKLQEQGALVLLSKKYSGKSSFDLSYADWYKLKFKEGVEQEVKSGRLNKDVAKSLLNQGPEANDVWDFFLKVSDIRNRAKIINDFHPHLTLIIHYNFGGAGIKEYKKFYQGKDRRLLSPTKENYSLMFVPGGIGKGELESKRDRLELLRLVLTKDLKKSVVFSSIVQNRVVSDLKIPSLPRNNAIDYARDQSNYAREGVYARNLKLTRLVHSPLCYAEPLLQNNISEAIELNKKSFIFEGHKTSPKVKKMAEVYYAAILEYVSKVYSPK